MASTLSDIQQFLEISPNLLTAGQPFAGQFEAIHAAGCQVVINLAAETAWDYLPEEEEIVQALGMHYIHIPVEWTAPQPEDLQAFFAAMQAHVGKKIFVHCARNMRVSAFVYLYRILWLEEPQEGCFADMLRIWQPDPTWQAFIDRAISAKIT